MNKRKKVLLYIVTTLMVLNFFGKREQKVMQTTISEIHEEYDSYSEGRIFYCDSSENATAVCQLINEKDIVVLDQLHFDDPNIKILSSYRITDTEMINEILCIIKTHFDMKESRWNRTIESMQNEWIIHNICSSLLIKKGSTDDVDLNNEDEELYNSKIITKILRN